MSKHYMNPARGRHMESGGDHDLNPGKDDGSEGGHEGKPHPHSISIHHAGQGEPSHSNPHHVHVHHADGSHEHSDHQNFDEAMNHAQSFGHSEPSEQPDHADGEGDGYPL